MLEFDIDGDELLRIDLRELIVAGWSGRDPAAIQEHVDELKALGVKPPSATPLFYRVGADRATTADDVQVLGEATSGEAEVFLLGTPQGMHVGLASDHTDRDAEAWSVAHSKQVCPKPVAPRLWRLREVLPHWDRLQLESYAVDDGEAVLYQQGPVSGLLGPEELLRRFGVPENRLAPGQAMLCGTLPAIGGVRPAQRFRMSLVDPVLERRIDHEYGVQTLPIVE